MHESSFLFEATLGAASTSFDGSRASKRIQSGISTLTASSADLFWQSPQCKTLILLRFFLLGITESKVS